METAATAFNGILPLTWSQIGRFYEFLLGRCLVLLFVALLVVAIECVAGERYRLTIPLQMGGQFTSFIAVLCIPGYFLGSRVGRLRIELAGERTMKLITRIASLFCLMTPLGCATIWSGPIVDAKCYASLQNNTNPDLIYIDRDFAGMIRYCAPRARTTSFAVVEQGGIPLRLDPWGNSQAAELVRKVGPRQILWVNVKGERASRRTLKVAQLSLVRTIRTTRRS
jgi:hypothetical protein